MSDHVFYIAGRPEASEPILHLTDAQQQPDSSAYDYVKLTLPDWFFSQRFHRQRQKCMWTTSLHWGHLTGFAEYYQMGNKRPDPVAFFNQKLFKASDYPLSEIDWPPGIDGQTPFYKMDVRAWLRAMPNRVGWLTDYLACRRFCKNTEQQMLAREALEVLSSIMPIIPGCFKTEEVLLKPRPSDYVYYLAGSDQKFAIPAWLKDAVAMHFVTDTRPEDVYLQIITKRETGRKVLYLKYQQFIGSRPICELQADELTASLKY